LISQFTPLALFNLPDYEIQALWDLYNATGGTAWDWGSDILFGQEWDFTGDPEPCTAPWQGIECTTLPQSDGHLHVNDLDLHRMRLNGTLPSSLFNLTYLQSLNFKSNSISGSIPLGIGHLSEVRTLDFSYNDFTGVLPSGLANCTKLSSLLLPDNLLTGTLPEGLGNISSIDSLELTDNCFVGPLPRWLPALPLLTTIEFSGNRFTGSIPDSYGTMTNLTDLSIGFNHLTGTIPTSFSNLTKVAQLELSLNKLHGTIPAWLGELNNLVHLFLDHNDFTGTIPESLGQLQQLTFINLCNNMLTGTIPPSASRLTALTTLKLDENFLQGPISSFLTSMLSLNTLDLSNNMLSGSLPSTLGRMTGLYSAGLNANFLTGTISSSLGNLSEITVLNLGNNNLRGSVPRELGKLRNLGYLYLQDNFLTGTLPPELSHLEGIVTLFAQNNSLHGTLDRVFNATRQRKLSLIQLGSNEFTGTVPDEMIALPSLLTLVLVENCFSGVRLESICGTNLSTVILDGLHSAQKCRGALLPGISNAYVLTSQSLGTVPPCLFSTRFLNTLHLSSNRLTGSLPQNISIASPLFDLALSHNKLTGNIPPAIQFRFWFNLDLSYNKFGGEMDDRLGAGFNSSDSVAVAQLRNKATSSGLPSELPPSALTLCNNRLSDHVPASVQSMLNISVLSGNLFTCNFDDSDLPVHDAGRTSYHCGSGSFDRSYYLWIALVVALGAVLLVFSWWLHTVPTTERGAYYASLLCRVQSWYAFSMWYASTDPSLSMVHLKHVVQALDAVSRAAFWVTAAILFVMLPAYAAARAYYGTHSHEYAWAVSAAFLSGYPAVGMLLSAFTVYLAATTFVYKWQARVTGQGEPVREAKPKQQASALQRNFSSARVQATALYLLYFAVNFAVSFSANALYVAIILREDSKYFVPAQVGLSVFKVCWNSIGAVRLARWTWQKVVSIRGAYARQDSSFFSLQLFVGMFNYIAIPCLVVGVVSPDCFNTLFVGQTHVSSSYFYESCEVFGRTSCVYQQTYTAKTSFVPPFTYSYQCSSSLITYYAASFVYMALIVTFVNPTISITLRWLYLRRHSMPRLAATIEWVCPSVLMDVSQDAVVYNAYSPYFDARQRIVEVMTYFGVLLTFGLVFPPLAAAMLVAIVASVAATKVKIGRFLTTALDAGQPLYLQLVDSECKGVASQRMLRICATQLLLFTCFFYVPFLFDTLSDAVGTTEALWVVNIAPLFPALIFAGNALAERLAWEQRRKPRAGLAAAATEDIPAAAERITEVEMSNVELGGVSATDDQEGSTALDGDGTATHSALHAARNGTSC
jgi:Leucine-rich repeat (LRR) protein